MDILKTYYVSLHTIGTSTLNRTKSLFTFCHGNEQVYFQVSVLFKQCLHTYSMYRMGQNKLHSFPLSLSI